MIISVGRVSRNACVSTGAGCAVDRGNVYVQEFGSFDWAEKVGGMVEVTVA